ncbi:MAG TPA: hypothetical protein VNN72_03850 [Polyangiaceae bacterium]|nr:hypothetical protein [Polyangiaceae bacterium]
MFGGGFALGVVAVLASTVAPSDATGIRIELDAPPDCATAEAFYESVRRRTERVRPVIEGEAGVRVVVRLTRVGARAHGELRVIGEHGESDTRRVDGNTCTEVVDALSLTVALAVDPNVHIAPPEPVAPPPPVVESAPPPLPPPEEPPPPPPPPERNLETHIGAAVVAMGQVTPYVSFGGELSLRFVMPWESASSFGMALIHIQNDLFSPADNASVRSTMFQLEACPARFGDATALTLEPCLQGLGGWLSVEGRDVAHSESVTRSYFSLGGSLVGGAAFGKGFGAELSVGFAVPMVRRRFVVLEPRRQVAETPSISAIGTLALTYSF